MAKGGSSKSKIVLMNHREFAYILNRNNISDEDAAKMLNSDVPTIKAYKEGRFKISSDVSKTIRSKTLNNSQGGLRRP